jgi:hypothetical protein
VPFAEIGYCGRSNAVARYFSLEARVVEGDALGILKIQTEAYRLKFGVTQRRCYEATRDSTTRNGEVARRRAGLLRAQLLQVHAS